MDEKSVALAKAMWKHPRGKPDLGQLSRQPDQLLTIETGMKPSATNTD